MPKEVIGSAMVVGGGVSGMAAARSLASQGYETHIIEKEAHLGGQARKIYSTAAGDSVPPKLAELVYNIRKNKKIHVHLETEISQVEGFVGNFEATLASNGNEAVLEHGVAIMATGATPYQPDEYQYGKDPRILTSLELDGKFIENRAILKYLNTAGLFSASARGNRSGPAARGGTVPIRFTMPWRSSS